MSYCVNNELVSCKRGHPASRVDSVELGFIIKKSSLEAVRYEWPLSSPHKIKGNKSH